MKNENEEENYMQQTIKKQIDDMLSFGSVNLGLNRVEGENTAKTRLEEDIKK